MNIPNTKSGLMRLSASDLDAMMVFLGRQPFAPVTALNRRRDVLWQAIVTARIRSIIATPIEPQRAAGVVNYKPSSSLPRAPKDNNSLIRALFVAALAGIVFEDAVLVSRAHFEGQGDFGMNHRRTARTAFRIMAGLGWGVETTGSGLVRVYR